MQIVDADTGIALSAPRIKATDPIACVDTFAVALARNKDAYLLTGNPEFKKLEVRVPIEKWKYWMIYHFN